MFAIHIELILMVTGVLTASMLLQFFAPVTMVRRNFGVELKDDVSIFLARHWGLLVFCFGVLLFMSAKNDAIRVPVMVAAGAEKIALIGFILAGPMKKHPSTLFIAIADSVMVLLYAGYLLGL